MSVRPDPMEFEGTIVERPDGGRSLEVWCPWCETHHGHGAADHAVGDVTSRAAHCPDRVHAPARDYIISIGSAAPQAELPDAVFLCDHWDDPQRIARWRPLPARARFGERIRRSRTVAAAFVRAMLSVAITDRDRQRVEIAPGLFLHLFGRGAWWKLSRDRGQLAQGMGLISLVCQLYGLTPGVAAVRALEAATLVEFDEQAASEVAAAIDRWTERGQSRRGHA